MKLIAYYRVSTKMQGESGLGLTAQRNDVEQFAETNGFEILESYTDIASGSNVDRRGLSDAISHAIRVGGTIIVKRLDRLSRDGFRVVSQLEDYGIDFIESDNPNESDLVKYIKMAVAKDEKEKIAGRVRDAFNVIRQEIEENGFYITKAGKKMFKFGGYHTITEDARVKGVEKIKTIARNNENNLRASAYIVRRRDDKDGTFQNIANELNLNGYQTSRGKSFTKMTVKRLYDRHLRDNQ